VIRCFVDSILPLDLRSARILSKVQSKTMTSAKPQTETKRKVLLYPGEDGYFVVEVPSLPGCITQGKTREEALANVEEAIGLYIEVL
jgi:hypothetical protein